MKVLIVGITGFAGVHLYQLLKQKEDISLFGTYRHSSKTMNLIKNFSRAALLECDVSDIYSIERVLCEVEPDVIFHFASYVSVHSSFKNPLPTFQINIIGTANLLEAIRKIVPFTKILIPGSAEEYGKVPQDKMPIKEDYSLNPINPYAISKRVQEDLGFYYHKIHSLNIFFTRTFHYTGPGQPLGFVCSDFAKQVVDIENGKVNKLKVGNLDAKRDFTDIRDVVNGYWEIVNRGELGEVYNVCRGASIKIQEILQKLINLSEKKVSVETDVDKLRPSDVPDFVGDNTKLRDLDWAPKYTIDDSLRDLLEWWRNEVKKG